MDRKLRRRCRCQRWTRSSARIARGLRPGPAPPGAGDEVAGVAPVAGVARPGRAWTEVERADAGRGRAAGLAVVPRGAGTRLDWGMPPHRCDLLVDTRGAEPDPRARRRRPGRPVRGRAARSTAGRDARPQPGQQLALDPPRWSRRDGRRHARHRGRRAAAAALRHARATCSSASRGAGRRRGRHGGRQGRQERRRIRPGQAPHRLVTARSGIIAEAAFRLHPVPRRGPGSAPSVPARSAARATPSSRPCTPAGRRRRRVDAPAGGPVTAAVLDGGRARRASPPAPPSSYGCSAPGAAVSGRPPDWWGRSGVAPDGGPSSSLAF